MNIARDHLLRSSLLNLVSTQRLVALAALAASAALGCAAPLSADEGTAVADDALHGVPGTYWPKGSDGLTSIPVCWTFDGYDQDKQWVKDFVVSGWGSVASVRFLGWGRCDGSTPNQAIRISHADAMPTTIGLGTLGTGPGQTAAITLNFVYNAWNLGTPMGSDGKAGGVEDKTCHNYRQYCDGATALHAFGTALGMLDETQYTAGQALSGGYDANSVMNVTVVDASNSPGFLRLPWPALSPQDVQGLLTVYGLAPGRVPVFSFHSEDPWRFQYQTNPTVAGPGWIFDGAVFYGVESSRAGAVPVYGFHAQDPWRYDYSTNPAVGAGWTADGVAFYTVPGPIAVNQFHADGPWRTIYSPAANVGSGWAGDGVAFYSVAQSAPSAVPIYTMYANGPWRQYYTTSPTPGPGWTNGGVAFYDYPVGVGQVPVYQFHADSPWRTYYSTSSNPGAGWALDGQAFSASRGTVTPVYKLTAESPWRVQLSTSTAVGPGWTYGELLSMCPDPGSAGRAVKRYVF